MFFNHHISVLTKEFCNFEYQWYGCFEEKCIAHYSQFVRLLLLLFNNDTLQQIPFIHISISFSHFLTYLSVHCYCFDFSFFGFFEINQLRSKIKTKTTSLVVAFKFVIYWNDRDFCVQVCFFINVFHFETNKQHWSLSLYSIKYLSVPMVTLLKNSQTVLTTIGDQIFYQYQFSKTTGFSLFLMVTSWSLNRIDSLFFLTLLKWFSRTRFRDV